MDKKIKKQKTEVNKLKIQFIENIEHDLRNLINGIINTLSYCLVKTHDKDIKYKLKSIVNSNELLVHLLNNILDFNKLDHGMYQAPQERLFSLPKLINDVLVIEKSFGLARKLTITSKYERQAPRTIIGDEFKLQRILLNLVNNAIKFTPHGKVQIITKFLKKLNSQHVILEISIKDTGLGIPENMQNIIFEKFVRLHAPSDNKYPGTGLGLSTVKKFIDDLNGNIIIESQIGLGSTFKCLIPFKIPNPSTRIFACKSGSKNGRSVIINLKYLISSGHNKQSIKKLLEKFTYKLLNLKKEIAFFNEHSLKKQKNLLQNLRNHSVSCGADQLAQSAKKLEMILDNTCALNAENLHSLRRIITQAIDKIKEIIMTI